MTLWPIKKVYIIIVHVKIFMLHLLIKHFQLKGFNVDNSNKLNSYEHDSSLHVLHRAIDVKGAYDTMSVGIHEVL